MVLRVFLLLLCLASHDSRAAAPRPLLTDYSHTAWSETDGGPSGATGFAQGADGWLWIASPTGLYRFDGVRFERMQAVYGHALQSSNLTVVTTAADGALWVGYRVGSVSVFRRDGSRSYAENEGLQPVGVMDIRQAPDGAVWVAMRDGVALLAPGASRFHYLPEDAGVPRRGIFQIMFARDGTVWLGTNSGAYFRKPGDRRFTHVRQETALVNLAEGPDGTIWASDLQERVYRMSPGAAARYAFPGQGVLFDRQRVMWVRHSRGMERRLVPDSPSAADQYLSTSDKLSGPLPAAPFEDREGNLWVGTSGGIDRLRRNRLITMPVGQPLRNPALVAGPAGESWVGDYSGDVWRVGTDGRERREVAGQITASHTTADGVIWLGGMDGVLRRAADGTVTRLPFPDGVQGLRVHALQQDRDGVLWAAFSTGKVYRLLGGEWRERAGLPALLTTTMALDGGDNLWLGHLRSQISVIAADGTRQLGPQQGLALGTILALAADGAVMWVGGEGGVAMYRDGRFTPLRGERGERYAGVSGIVRLPGGDLWLHGADGLYRITGAELQRWLRDGEPVAFARFNAQDGMQGRAPQWRPLPSLRLAADGLLWYATSGAVGSLDPAGLLRNALPPPVEITGAQGDGVHYVLPRSGPLHLPKGTLDLQIDFTALSLSIPERVRLRYRLSGWDRAWREVGGRREAYYNNLEPGRYRFEVAAANEDGVWNTEGAALEVVIAPTFVQSIWFKLLIAAALALALYIAYVLRIRYLTQLIQTRAAERMRIARALHDTLLQSVQGLLMSFEALRRHLPQGSPESLRLDQTLNLGEQLLVEGRDQIMDLRTSHAPEVLSLTLEEFGKGLAEHRPHAFEMRVGGKPRRLRPKVHTEAYAIGREALFNASRYAGATRIALELEYGDHAFILRVRDNGCGLDEAVLAAGGRAGHWGLPGMRERAHSIGAQLALQSKPASGLDVTLTVPAKRAY